MILSTETYVSIKPLYVITFFIVFPNPLIPVQLIQSDNVLRH